MSNREKTGQPDQNLPSDHDSPYPVSRLAPPFSLIDLAGEIAQADQMISNKVEAQLEMVARQIRSLQDEARRILERAKQDKDLHRAHCAFPKKAGNTYHLYRRADGSLYFSMLSPADWPIPPHPFCGSFRLEADFSWTKLQK